MKASERDELLIRIDQKLEDSIMISIEREKRNTDEHNNIIAYQKAQNGRVRKNTLAIVAITVSMGGGVYGILQWII